MQTELSAVLAQRGTRQRLPAVIVSVLALSLPMMGDDPAPTPAGARTAPASSTAVWKRVVIAPFDSPAGDLCTFTLHSEPVFDRVYVRTTRTFSDGSPRRQEYSGPLVVKLTNEATGKSIRRDLSGRAVATYDRNGAYRFLIQGPAAVGFRAYRGDSLPTGYYVLTGTHVVRFGVDGTRRLTYDRGREENVCITLS